jgi:tetratricopeptide (TPR) repeat protein
MQRDSRQRLEAIKLLEQMKQEAAMGINDQILLAALYDSVGKWPEARTLVMPLLAARKLSPPYLLQMARSFLVNNQVADAEQCLEQLEQSQKDQPPALALKALKARILKARKRDDDAIRLLKGFTPEKTSEQLEVASVIEEIKASAAEEVYRKCVQQSSKPEDTLVLAAYLGRQGRVPEALDVCERCLTTCAPEKVALTAVAILYSASAEPLQVERVSKWLQAAVTKYPESHALQVGLANVRNYQGRYEEAMSLYRKAIDPPTPSPEAMNNLAWLLAFHGQEAEALDLLKRAVDLVGPWPVFLDTRGVVELRLRQINPAVRDLEEASYQREDSPNSYFHLAQAYLAAGKGNGTRPGKPCARPRSGASSWSHSTRSSGVTTRNSHPSFSEASGAF